MISTQASITGVLSLDRPCTDEPAGTTSLTPLPEPQIMDQLPRGIDLKVGLRRDWATLSAELTETLRAGGSAAGQDSEGLTLTSVVARGVLVEKKRWVALTLQVEECGELSLIGEIVLEAKTNRATVRGLRSPVPGVPLDGPVQALASDIERRAKMTIPMDLHGATATVQQLTRRVTSLVPGDVELDLALQPPVLTSLEIDGDGLLAIAKLTGRLSARLR